MARLRTLNPADLRHHAATFVDADGLAVEAGTPGAILDQPADSAVAGKMAKLEVDGTDSDQSDKNAKRTKRIQSALSPF